MKPSRRVQRGKIHLAEYDEWFCDFEIRYLAGLILPATLNRLLEEAGRTVGVGEDTPAQGGEFGTFVVQKPGYFFPEFR